MNCELKEGGINMAGTTTSTTSSMPIGATGAGGGNMLRITGLNTGLDVDSMVKKMLTSDQTKIDQVKQQQQLVQWKQEAYQSIIKDVKDLQSAYFDVANASNYLLSSGNYDNMTATSSDTTGAVSAKTAAGAAAGTYKISVSQLAQAASISSSKSVSSQVELNTVQGWSGKTITFNDGTTDTNINVDSSFSGNIDDLVANLNSKIAASSLNGKLNVVNDNGKVKFENLSTTSDITLKDGSGIADIPDTGTGHTILKNDSYETGVIQNQNFSGWNGQTITFNGTTITLGNSSTSASDLVSDINSKINAAGLNGKVSASLVTTGSDSYIKFTLASSTTVTMTSSISDINVTNKTLISASSSTKLTDLKSTLTGSITLNLKYNGTSKTVTVDNTDGTATVDDLTTAIKTATGGEVTGQFDDMTGKFILQTTDTGSTSSLSIEQGSTGSETTTDLLTGLGFNNTLLAAPNNTEYAVAQGSDANVTITQPGSTTGTTLTESSNNFTVNGVSYSITGTTISDVSISVTQDTSKVHDLISNFIDKYNNLVGEIQDKLSERKDYNYQPLTDAQKSSMSATDITNWETKAKQGILENDDNLGSLLNDLTSAFNAPVLDSSGKSVSTLYFGSIGSNAIGIDTSNDYTQGAKLSITDDQQFTNALTNHADEIMKLFTTTSDSTDPTANFNQSGIFQRISQIINNNVGVIGSTYNSGTLTKYANLQDDYSISGGAGTGTLPDQIYQQQLLINNLTDQMNNDQTKYYDQFTQLETAMEQLNAQQSSLSMYLG